MNHNELSQNRDWLQEPSKSWSGRRGSKPRHVSPLMEYEWSIANLYLNGPKLPRTRYLNRIPVSELPTTQPVACSVNTAALMEGDRREHGSASRKKQSNRSALREHGAECPPIWRKAVHDGSTRDRTRSHTPCYKAMRTNRPGWCSLAMLNGEPARRLSASAAERQ